MNISLHDFEFRHSRTSGRFYINVVPEVGLEPTCLAAHDFESCVYTSFTTLARSLVYPCPHLARIPPLRARVTYDILIEISYFVNKGG